MKKHIWHLMALVLFFALQLYFFHFEYNLDSGAGVVLAVMLFFLVFYAVSMFDVPNFVLGIISFCGVFALCYLSHVQQNDQAMDDLVPLTYLPVCLFLIAQFESLQKKQSKAAASFWLALFCVCPVLLLGVLIWVLIKSSETDVTVFSALLNFTTVLFLLLIVLYLLVLRTPVKKMKNTQNAEFPAQKTLFVNAVIVMAETALFAVFYDHMILKNTVPLLWMLNLMILYEQSHPLVRAFASRTERDMKRFLESD